MIPAQSRLPLDFEAGQEQGAGWVQHPIVPRSTPQPWPGGGRLDIQLGSCHCIYGRPVSCHPHMGQVGMLTPKQ